MRLSELIAGLPVAGELGADPEVKGLAYDSRRVAPGDLFVVWIGQRHDGRAFAAEAVERGAVAVLTPPPATSGSTESALSGLPWLTAADPRALLGPLAARLWEQPDRELCRHRALCNPAFGQSFKHLFYFSSYK